MEEEPSLTVDMGDTDRAAASPRRSRRPRIGSLLPSGRGRQSGLDLRNTWQVMAGAILVPLGVAVILLGWSGAAHGRVDQQQIPYLISGGILGLAAVLVGCFFFWAHWLYRMYDQADLHHRQALEEQREMLKAVLDALAGRPAGAPVPPVPAGEPVPAASNGSRPPTFVATQLGNNFHTPDCPMLANRAGNLREVSESEARAMKPCRVCDPVVHAG